MTPFVHAPLSGPRSPFLAVRQAGGAARSPLAALAADDVRARPSPSANTCALQALSVAAGSSAAGATRKRARAAPWVTARRADGTAPQTCRAPRAPCVVVLINQVTTRANEVLGTSGLAPALGEAWAHMCNVQVSLEWCDGVRLAALSKGRGPGEAQLAVTADGI